MNRALAIVTVLSLFVAGIAIGALGMHIYQDRQLRHPDDPQRPGRGFLGRRLHHQLDRQLDLSVEQLERIEAILQSSHEKAMELRNDLHPRVMTIMDRAHDEIADILDPEQREKFQQLLQDNRRRAEHFFLGPPGRGRGHGRRGPWGGPGRRPWGPPRDGSRDGPRSDRPGDRPPEPGEDGTGPADPPPDPDAE